MTTVKKFFESDGGTVFGGPDPKNPFGIQSKEHKSDILESTFAHDLIEGAKSLFETEYSKAWDAFKSTPDYSRSFNALFEKGIKNPYASNILQSAFEMGWNLKNTIPYKYGDLIEWLNSECPTGTNDLSHDFAENLRNRLDNLKSSNGDGVEAIFHVIRARNGRGESNLLLVIEEAVPDTEIGSVLIVPYAEGYKDPVRVKTKVDAKGFPVTANDRFVIVTEFIYK